MGAMFFTMPTLLTWAPDRRDPAHRRRVLPAARRARRATWWPRCCSSLCALTDWLDGWLARKLNQTSSFGAFLDPVADKFLICAALLVLLQLDRVERAGGASSSSAARSRSRRCASGWRRSAPSRSVAVHMLGKLKTVVQMVAIPFLLYDGALFGVIDTRHLGHLADVRRRGADDLVDGVLPAQGDARDPRQGAMTD